MTLEELDRLFEDPTNRRWRLFYHCRADPRVVAPSRPSAKGWQINLAHPKAFRVMLLYLVVLVGPASCAFALRPGDSIGTLLLVAVTFAASVAVLIALSYHLSMRHAD